MEKALGLKKFNVPLFLIHRLLFTVCAVVSRNIVNNLTITESYVCAKYKTGPVN